MGFLRGHGSSPSKLVHVGTHSKAGRIEGPIVAHLSKGKLHFSSYALPGSSVRIPALIWDGASFWVVRLQVQAVYLRLSPAMTFGDLRSLASYSGTSYIGLSSETGDLQYRKAVRNAVQACSGNSALDRSMISLSAFRAGWFKSS